MTETVVNDKILSNDLQSLPVGPKPRQPLKSYLQRSIANTTMLQRSPNATYMNNSKKVKSMHAQFINYENQTHSFDESNSDDSTPSDDDSYLFQSVDENFQTSFNKSRNSTESEEHNSFQYTKSVKCTKYKNKSPKHSSHLDYPKIKQKDKTKENDRSYVHYFWGLSVFIIVIAALCISFLNHPESTDTNQNDKKVLLKELDDAIESLAKQFPKQQTYTWYEIIPSIKNVVQNQNKPSMIILFANESYTMNCLARAIAIVSMRALQTNSFLTLTRDNMGIDLGEILIALRPKIQEQKVVIVQDLLNLHPQALKAFHNFCDRENPFINEAVYILTMIVKDNEQIENPLEYVENEIIKKYSQFIDMDTLMPLVTRLTEGPALQVQPHKDAHNCFSV